MIVSPEILAIALAATGLVGYLIGSWSGIAALKKAIAETEEATKKMRESAASEKRSVSNLELAIENEKAASKKLGEAIARHENANQLLELARKISDGEVS